MKNAKLWKVLQKLSPREQLRFSKYVASPFFNKHEQVMALYVYLASFLDAPEEQCPTRQQTQKALTIKDKPHFNHITSYLLQLLLDFLGYLEQEEQPLEQQQYKIRALRKRNLTLAIPTTIKQYEQAQQRYPYQDTNLYRQQYGFYQEQDALFLLESTKRYDSNLQQKSDVLDVYYILSKLQIACDMASRNIIIEANYTPHLLSLIEQVLAEQPDYQEQYPAIAIYATILKMLTTAENEQSYHRLQDLLVQHIPLFSLAEGQQLFDYAQNYCIRQINRGASGYYQEFLELYKLQLKFGILLKDGFLEEWDFKNIVTVGVRLKDFEWTERFIRNNKKTLKPAVQENAYRYNLAVYYYATRQYKEALQLLYQVEFTDSTYHLGAKNIQLKSYYELGESEAFGALVDAFRIYVKRNKQLSTYRKEVYFNFLKIAKKLENLKQKKDYISSAKFEAEKQQLQTYIAENKAANSDWIALAWQELQ